MFPENPPLTVPPVNQARLLLLAAAALYGTNFSLVKLMGEASTFPVAWSTTLRFGLAALATMPWLMVDPEESEVLGATIAGFEVGLWNSVGYVAQAVGLETTPASESAFLCSMAVVVVPLLDFVFSGKNLLPRQWTGVLLAILGVGALELGDHASLSLSTGDLISMIQPVAFGLGFWRMEQAMRSYSNQANRCTAAQLLAVFVGSACFAGLTESPMDVPVVMAWLHDPNVVLSLLWTGIVTTAMTIYMETIALKTLTASETTLIMSTEPLSGSAFAAVVMAERFGPNAVAGALLIMMGCLVSNLGMDKIRAFFEPTDEEED